MVITLSWASIESVAGIIFVIGSAWKVVMEAKKAVNTENGNSIPNEGVKRG